VTRIKENCQYKVCCRVVCIVLFLTSLRLFQQCSTRDVSSVDVRNLAINGRVKRNRTHYSYNIIFTIGKDFGGYLSEMAKRSRKFVNISTMNTSSNRFSAFRLVFLFESLKKPQVQISGGVQV
jgi:hypothetical protein